MNWDDYRIFDEVVRARSVRAAARALGVDHGTVSRRISRLETELGARLLTREPHGVGLTEAGQELRDAAARVRTEVQSAERRLKGWDGALSGIVRVSTHSTLCRHVVMPGLGTFHRKHPDIHLELSLSHHTVNLSTNEADVAIRVASTPPDEALAQRTSGLAYAVYASRSYRQSHTPDKTPERCSWIGWGDLAYYPRKLKDSRFPDVPVVGTFVSIASQVDATREGLGLAALPVVLGDSEPDLVRLTEPEIVTSVFVLLHPDHRRTARIRAFTTHMQDHLTACAQILEG